MVVTPKLSFAQVVKGPQVQFSYPFSIPSIRGDTLSIKIMHEAYARGLEACMVNLRGRLVLTRGITHILPRISLQSCINCGRLMDNGVCYPWAGDFMSFLLLLTRTGKQYGHHAWLV